MWGEENYLLGVNGRGWRKRMPDMLVKLYNLSNLFLAVENLATLGITIRRTMLPEKDLVQTWILRKFGEQWSTLCETAFMNRPISCFIAIKDGGIIGFACYDVTFRNVFGPIGVNEVNREQGIGQALLSSCLHSMKEIGYVYAIIGRVGPVEFYTRTVNAIIIQDSDPGCFTAILGEQSRDYPALLNE